MDEKMLRRLYVTYGARRKQEKSSSSQKNQTITYDHLFVCERLYLASLLKGNFLTICEKEVRIMVNMMEVYQFHNILMILWNVIY